MASQDRVGMAATWLVEHLGTLAVALVAVRGCSLVVQSALLKE